MDKEIHRGKNKHQDHEGFPNESQCYYLVSLLGYPDFGYVDTLEGVIEVLKNMEEEEVGNRIVVTSQILTEQEFNELPEFTGF